MALLLFTPVSDFFSVYRSENQYQWVFGYAEFDICLKHCRHFVWSREFHGREMLWIIVATNCWNISSWKLTLCAWSQRLWTWTNLKICLLLLVCFLLCVLACFSLLSLLCLEIKILNKQFKEFNRNQLSN